MQERWIIKEQLLSAKRCEEALPEEIHKEAPEETPKETPKEAPKETHRNSSDENSY